MFWVDKLEGNIYCIFHPIAIWSDLKYVGGARTPRKDVFPGSGRESVDSLPYSHSRQKLGSPNPLLLLLAWRKKGEKEEKKNEMCQTARLSPSSAGPRKLWILVKFGVWLLFCLNRTITGMDHLQPLEPVMWQEAFIMQTMTGKVMGSAWGFIQKRRKLNFTKNGVEKQQKKNKFHYRIYESDLCGVPGGSYGWQQP